MARSGLGRPEMPRAPLERAGSACHAWPPSPAPEELMENGLSTTLRYLARAGRARRWRLLALRAATFALALSVLVVVALLVVLWLPASREWLVLALASLGSRTRTPPRVRRRSAAGWARPRRTPPTRAAS